MGEILGLLALLVAVPAAIAAFFTLRSEIGSGRSERIRKSQEEFARERKVLNQIRPSLPVSAAEVVQSLDGSLKTIGNGRLIVAEEWIDSDGWDLDSVTLRRSDQPVSEPDPPRTPLPLKDDGTRFASYSEAMEKLCRPALFDDWRSYRLVGIQACPAELVLEFADRACDTSYFKMIDSCEALAHEAARNKTRTRAKDDWSLRENLATPRDLSNRYVVPSISALTIRCGDDGSGTFVLHKRDGANVAVSSSTLHVVPSGVFQPSTPLARKEDFSIWTCIMREYAEEYLGFEDAQRQEGFDLDYESDEPFCSLNEALNAGAIRFKVFGVGIDPVTWVYEILAVALIDGGTFDQVFEGMVQATDEGIVTGLRPTPSGFLGSRFDIETLATIAAEPALAPAAAGLVDLATRHYDELARSIQEMSDSRRG